MGCEEACNKEVGESDTEMDTIKLVLVPDGILEFVQNTCAHLPYT